MGQYAAYNATRSQRPCLGGIAVKVAWWSGWEEGNKSVPASIYLPAKSREDLAMERTSGGTIKFRAHTLGAR